MIPRIRSIEALDNYVLKVVFDDGKKVFYNVKEDFCFVCRNIMYTGNMSRNLSL